MEKDFAVNEASLKLFWKFLEHNLIVGGGQQRPWESK